MYHNMSLCNIPILSSFKPKHRFTSNFMWMYPGRALTKIFKIGVLPLFSMELWVILCNFWSILKNSFFYETTDQKSFIYLVWKSPDDLISRFFVIYIYSFNKRYLILDYPLNRCTYLLQIWCGFFLGGPLPDLFKIRVLPYFQ